MQQVRPRPGQRLIPNVPMNPNQATDQGMNPAPTASMQDLVIDHIPQLGGPGKTLDRVSLMPKTGGVVGITYAVVPASKVKNAHDCGWRRPRRGSIPFTIKGPLGSINCDVIEYGEQIPGIPTSSCRCTLMCDKMIWDTTGLNPQTGRWPEVEPIQPEHEGPTISNESLSTFQLPEDHSQKPQGASASPSTTGNAEVPGIPKNQTKATKRKG